MQNIKNTYKNKNRILTSYEKSLISNYTFTFDISKYYHTKLKIIIPNGVISIKRHEDEYLYGKLLCSLQYSLPNANKFLLKRQNYIDRKHYKIYKIINFIFLHTIHVTINRTIESHCNKQCFLMENTNKIIANCADNGTHLLIANNGTASENKNKILCITKNIKQVIFIKANINKNILFVMRNICNLKLVSCRRYSNYERKFINLCIFKNVYSLIIQFCSIISTKKTLNNFKCLLCEVSFYDSSYTVNNVVKYIRIITVFKNICNLSITHDINCDIVKSFQTIKILYLEITDIMNTMVKFKYATKLMLKNRNKHYRTECIHVLQNVQICNLTDCNFKCTISKFTKNTIIGKCCLTIK